MMAYVVMNKNIAISNAAESLMSSMNCQPFYLTRCRKLPNIMGLIMFEKNGRVNATSATVLSMITIAMAIPRTML